MPLTIRDKDGHLTPMLDTVLAGGRITDISKIAAFRQILESGAAEFAQADFLVYAMKQSLLIDSATGEDLAILMRNHGLAPDEGQAASDPVTFTRIQGWLDDIALPAPQILQATLADGATVLYRSLGDAVLQPQGRSVSGQAPGVSVASGINDQIRLNLDSDGMRTITLGTQTSATAIASALQTAVRALTANSAENQPAYDGFRCDYNITTLGTFTLRSGGAGPTSSVVVTTGATHDATFALKLGLAQGGRESIGQDTVNVAMLCDSIGVIGNVGAGQIQTQVTPVTGIQTVANALMFANGREPASDDANRQDLRSYLKALGIGGSYAVERAVYSTVGDDGQRHVLSAQVLYGAGLIQVYICDGRSLTVGAQTAAIEDVQDELDGLGNQVGGWIAGGAHAGVAPATIRTVNYDVTVYVASTVDLVRAQQLLSDALYTLTYQWPVGQILSAVQVTQRMEQVVDDLLDVVFSDPPEFTRSTDRFIEGILGRKPMPGTIVVDVRFLS